MNFLYFQPITETGITVLANDNVACYFQQMDIVVSLTSEAIFESQWLEYNFIQVQKYIRPDAIFIPHQSSLTIMPITAAKACSSLHDGQNIILRNISHQNGMEKYSIRAQTMSILYTRNVFECATGQELFTFNHEHRNGARILTDKKMKRLQFTMDSDCNVTGFGAYHQSNLYKDVSLNNYNMLNVKNENCIPMAYFPLKNPQLLTGQQKLEITFWLNGDAVGQRHWYEWQITSPLISCVHNVAGAVYSLFHYN